ncbi:hypothetical protein GD1_88 [Paraglaciecola Antarctic GD virus 1]|nr:hypothetical protein GD1_88 [Paraglaciecola Antarctic GD virus 1]
MMVDINWLMMVKKRLAEINAQEFQSIQWVKDGEELTLTEYEIYKFETYGLNNQHIVDFLRLTK